MFHFYKVTNTINGKSYIGYTGKLHPKNRWKEHLRYAKKGTGSVLHAAIRKYGPEVFTFEILSQLEGDTNAAILQEAVLISEHKSLVCEGGYNVLVTGGTWTEEQKRVHSERTKEGMTAPKIRQQMSESHKAYYAEGGVHPMQGKHHSAESIQKMSETTKAMITEEDRERCRQMSLDQWQDPERRIALLDHIQNPSEETCQKMSQTKLGKPTWNKGKEHRQESIERMSATKRGKKASSETKRKMSESRSAYLTPERRRAISEQMTGHRKLTSESKRKIGVVTRKYQYQVTLPDGSQQAITSLAQFCQEQGLNEFTARVAAKKNRATKSGYKFQEIPK